MDTLSEARRAHAEQDWVRAFELLSDPDPARLDADDLSALADAAWWLGKLDESVAARERAYEARSASGDVEGAALEAFSLSLALGDKGEDSLAAGWRARAYRLTEAQPGSLAVGYLLSMEATAAFHAGRPDDCIDKAATTIEIGKKHGDDTLVAWAMHVQGLGLVKRGDIDRGWERLDESMLALTKGQLKPMWAGLMHCGMLVACEEFGDPRRGWQWVEATEKWLGTVPGAVLYPGVCRIHKVHIMQLRGTWIDAEAEARDACADLVGVHAYTAGRGYYEIAEIKRLTGDYEAAQDLYRQAHALGCDPQPGLARLRLAQGRIEAAAAGSRRALSETTDPLLRAILLPAHIEASLAAGDVDEATHAADELVDLSVRYRSPRMVASAAAGRGLVLLATNDPQGALAELRKAIVAWRDVDCRYEVARARAAAAAALSALGDEDGATLELEAARAVFEDLGALPDARSVAEKLGKRSVYGGLSGRELEVLRLVAAGHSNKEIAGELVISENTVARHLQNIFVKLDVSSRAAAAAVALKQGLA